MPVISDITQWIGGTPLLKITGNIWGKLECCNPLSSAKDRAAWYMIRQAEQAGALRPGGVIIEPTSGNTGIALAGIGAARGYRVVLTMPENMSEERRRLLRFLGAELILTPAEEGMEGAVREGKALVKMISGVWMPDQFSNPANAQAHYETTGPEIWEDTAGEVDIFIACVGTGGSLTGVGRYLKEKKPEVKIVAVEPRESPLLSGGRAGRHGIQGIGANFIPELLDRSLMDEIFTVPTDCAVEYARKVARTLGIGVGISSGAALWAAEQMARRPACSGKCAVALLPDGGDRYLSTALCEGESSFQTGRLVL